MGVKKLTSHINSLQKTHFKQITKYINHLTLDYIIIDFIPFVIELFSKKNISTIYGGEFLTFKKHLVLFINFLRNDLNIEPVFVTDALRQGEKGETQLNRIENRVKDILKFIPEELAEENGPMDEQGHEKPKGSRRLNGMLTWLSELRLLLTQLNVEVYVPITDGDTLTIAIAKKYLNDHNASGVMVVSNDSDFYIFDYHDSKNSKTSKISYCQIFSFFNAIKKYKNSLEDGSIGSNKYDDPNLKCFFKCFNQEGFLKIQGLAREKLIYIPLIFGNDYVDPVGFLDLSTLEGHEEAWQLLKNNTTEQLDKILSDSDKNPKNKLTAQQIEFNKSFYTLKEEFSIGYSKNNYNHKIFINSLKSIENQNFSQKIPEILWKFYFHNSGSDNEILAEHYLNNIFCNCVIEDLGHASQEWGFRTKVSAILTNLLYFDNDHIESTKGKVYYYREVGETKPSPHPGLKFENFNHVNLNKVIEMDNCLTDSTKIEKFLKIYLPENTEKFTFKFQKLLKRTLPESKEYSLGKDPLGKDEIGLTLSFSFLISLAHYLFASEESKCYVEESVIVTKSIYVHFKPYEPKNFINQY